MSVKLHLSLRLISSIGVLSSLADKMYISLYSFPAEGGYQMPEHIYSISEIREQITRLPEQFEHEPGAVALTVAP